MYYLDSAAPEIPYYMDGDGTWISLGILAIIIAIIVIIVLVNKNKKKEGNNNEKDS